MKKENNYLKRTLKQTYFIDELKIKLFVLCL